MKLTFKQFLQEAPLPDDWDKETYNERNSFAKRINYAKERDDKKGTELGELLLKTSKTQRKKLYKSYEKYS